jgi:hypothetical protein
MTGGIHCALEEGATLMSVLHLDAVPEELFRRIAELADADKVAPAEKALQLLRQAVEREPPQSRAHVKELLERARRNAIIPKPGTPDSVEMLREDRDR